MVTLRSDRCRRITSIGSIAFSELYAANMSKAAQLPAIVSASTVESWKAFTKFHTRTVQISAVGH